MKAISVLLALATAPTALAHTTWTDFYVDGVAQGDGVAMRMRMDPAKASFPIEDLSSNDMACNVDGSKGVSRVQPVKDGSTLTFEIRSWPNDITKIRLDRAHYGPCAVYLKKVDSAIDDQGHGDGWFKLFDDGYEASTNKWCTDKIIDNNGLLSIVLPKGLKGGYYLARPEILALHNANKGDPQFYTGCAQIFLEGTGDLVPEETVSIPGYVNKDDKSVTFDIYTEDKSTYPVPGPAVAKLSSTSSAQGTTLSSQSTQSEGQRPQGCIDENANWCGKEVSSYSNETGCWASGEDCWAQARVCWDSAPPTGNAGCSIWQDKCQGINDACKAGDFDGPPNKGKDLTPKKSTIDVGTIMPTSAGGGASSTPQAGLANNEVATGAPYSTPSPSAEGIQSRQPAGEYVQGGTMSTAVAKTTITISASEGAPAPTAFACPLGYDCVTAYATVVKTEIVYQTVGAYGKRTSLHQRRAGHVQ